MTAMWTVSVLGLPHGKSSKQSLLEQRAGLEAQVQRFLRFVHFRLMCLEG